MLAARLVTSQNVTAPKPKVLVILPSTSLVTSQNVTAPKHVDCVSLPITRLVTSQNVTAPKLKAARAERVKA